LRSRQVEAEKIADAFGRKISLRNGADRLRIVCMVALPREKGRDAICPEALSRCQDGRSVVEQHVMFGWKTPPNVIDGLFLVDIADHTSVNRIGKARPARAAERPCA
jgi:DNA-binding Lrp family transcriptional regulator